MDRKKKKLNAQKAAANVEQQRKALKERFLNRSKEILRAIGGEALLTDIPMPALEYLYTCRYPVLKAKAAPGSSIPKSRVVQFNKLLLQLLENQEIILPNGNKIPLDWYLSEGLTLRDGVAAIDVDQAPPEFKMVKQMFTDFDHQGKFHQRIQEIILDIATDACTFLSDYNDLIFRADVSDTPYFAEYNPTNDIIIHTFAAAKQHMETPKGTREVFRLGWANPNLQWENFNVKPSLLGFPVKGLDIPLEIYISTHVLKRLQERINITPGVMHQILLLTFLQDEIDHHWHQDESLVAYRVADEKVGYLTVKLFQGKLFVTTFLFLTNEDTPEAKKLHALLNIEKADKKYLEIDNLPAFNSYHIDKNEQLSKLFKNAGCGSLLRLGHLQEFTANKLADKDPESILHYLADAPYFQKQNQNLDTSPFENS